MEKRMPFRMVNQGLIMVKGKRSFEGSCTAYRNRDMTYGRFPFAVYA
jgi:hypothetical protein